VRVLFVNVSADWKKTLGPFKSLAFTMMPPWICYLAAVVRQRGHGVEAIDQYESNHSFRGLVEDVLKRKPDVLAVSLVTPSVTSALKLLRIVRSERPQTKIILGNVHATYFHEELLRRRLADAVVHGEGEETLCAALDAMESGMPLSSVRGISFEEDRMVKRTEARPLLDDLDALPFPAWDLFDIKRYQPLLMLNSRRRVHIVLAGRGCPFRCSFCCNPFGRSYRVRSFQNIADEMEFFVRRFGVSHYVFLDGTFPISRRMGMEFCEAFMSRGLHKRVSWTGQCRIDLIEERMLRAMKEAGCVDIFFGIESGYDQGLVNLKKDFTMDIVREKMDVVRRSGIRSVGQFILGAPGETREDSLKTIQAGCTLGFDFVKFAILVPYPGTEFYEKYLKHLTFGDGDWERFSMYRADLPYPLNWLPSGRAARELLWLQRYGMLRFYLHPRRIFRTIYHLARHLRNGISLVLGDRWGRVRKAVHSRKE